MRLENEVKVDWYLRYFEEFFYFVSLKFIANNHRHICKNTKAVGKHKAILLELGV